MNFGTERNRKAWEGLTDEQKAAVEQIRAQHRTPQYRAEEARVRAEVRRQFPPKASPQASPELAKALARLRATREGLGLSLTDLQERTGIDRATISKLERGAIPNPTVATLDTYARAVGKRLVWALEEAGS